jgi:hypothetical protein
MQKGAELKVFINNRDLLTWPKRMTEFLLQTPGVEVIIIDNASTYPPLIAWYDTKPVEIVRLPNNRGQCAGWSTDEMYSVIKSEQCIYTDPDLDLSGIPDDWLSVLQAGLANSPKVGFGLSQRGSPPDNPHHADMQRLEADPTSEYRMFDRRGAEQINGVYYFSRGIATTFALYAPNPTRYGSTSAGGFSRALRTDYPYVARHLPWHLTLTEHTDPNVFSYPYDEEIHYYFTNAAHNMCGTKHILAGMTRQWGKQNAK